MHHGAVSFAGLMRADRRAGSRKPRLPLDSPFRLRRASQSELWSRASLTVRPDFRAANSALSAAPAATAKQSTSADARIHSFGQDGDGVAAYSDATDAVGFLVEAVEPPARMPPADFTP